MNLAAAGYLIATGLQAAGTLLFLSLATRILGVQQYGHWALLEPLLLLGGQIATMGLSSGVIKLIAQDGFGGRTALRMVGRPALLVGLAVAAIASLAVGYFLELGIYTGVVFLIIVAEARYVLLLSVLRGAGWAGQYAGMVACRVVMSISLLALIYVGGWGDRFDGRSISLVWLAALLLALLLNQVWAWRRKASEPEKSRGTDLAAYETAVSYGLPILGATVLSALLANSDRYILAGQVSTAEVSQYVLAGKVAAVLNLCVTPLNLWWPTVRFRRMNDADQGRSYFANMNLLICSGLTMLTVAVYLAAPLLLKVFAPQASYDPWVTGLLCLTALFISLSVPLNIGGLKQGKTHWVTVAVALAAAAQILLAFVLIPRFGLFGAACAAVASAALSMGFQNAISQRIHPVPFRYGYMLLTLAGWLGFSVLMSRSELSLPVKLGLFLTGVLIHCLLLRQSNSWQLMKVRK